MSEEGKDIITIFREKGKTLIAFRGDDELIERLNKQGNKSEFIREAVTEKLDKLEHGTFKAGEIYETIMKLNPHLNEMEKEVFSIVIEKGFDEWLRNHKGCARCHKKPFPLPFEQFKEELSKEFDKSKREGLPEWWPAGFDEYLGRHLGNKALLKMLLEKIKKQWLWRHYDRLAGDKWVEEFNRED